MLIGLMLHKNRKFRDFVWLHMEIGVVHTLTKTHTHTEREIILLPQLFRQHGT